VRQNLSLPRFWIVLAEPGLINSLIAEETDMLTSRSGKKPGRKEPLAIWSDLGLSDGPETVTRSQQAKSRRSLRIEVERI
jgi:hypothetical protein